MDRKLFIQNFARIMILTVFAVFTAFLVRKQKINLNETGAIHPYCKNCKSQANCKRNHGINQVSHEKR